jgi:hypothetical protein
LLLSRGVTLVRLVCCFVVRSSPSVRGGSGARRLFQVVMVAAYSAWGLALGHVGFPVHVWRCRRPFPYGGLDPLRRETSAATVAIHASGGRCSTRPCAHAIGPSSCSDPVRQQGWLNVLGRSNSPGGEAQSGLRQLHLCFSRRQVWLSSAKTRTTPRGRRAVSPVLSRTCAARSRHLSGVRLASSSWLGCIAVPSHLYSSDSFSPVQHDREPNHTPGH